MVASVWFARKTAVFSAHCPWCSNMFITILVSLHSMVIIGRKNVFFEGMGQGSAVYDHHFIFVNKLTRTQPCPFSYYLCIICSSFWTTVIELTDCSQRQKIFTTWPFPENILQHLVWAFYRILIYLSWCIQIIEKFNCFVF